MAPGGFTRGDVLLLGAVLAAFGLGDSAYLAHQWYQAPLVSWCDLDAYFSCTRVRESPYATVGGIPTAAVGIVGFAILLALLIVPMMGRDWLGPWRAESLAAAFAILGAAVGALLTFVEVTVIQALCLLCLLGFLLDLGVLGVALRAQWLATAEGPRE